MTELTQEQRTTLARLLDAREAELQAQVRAAHEAQAERPEALGRQVEDPAERGDERFRQGMEHAELLRDQEELRAIEQARERMTDGSYGQCVDCGCDIDFERLRAQPAAKRCIACQTVFEKTHPAAPRYQ